MTDLLRSAGEALYGPRWQRELARHLGVSDRTVRRWAAGANVPSEQRRRVAELVDRRSAGMRELASRLDRWAG